MHRLLTAVAVIATCVAISSPTRAGSSAEDQAAATSLFNDAKALMGDGKLAEACDKFALSLRFEQRIGTTLNLADCYERLGRTASAWARFNEAAALAQRANQPERVQFANEHAAALEPKLVKLVVVPAAKTEGLVVSRDGTPIDARVYGAAVPVDPGTHMLEAKAPLKRPWTRQIEIDPAQKQIDVIVPALDDDPDAIRAAKEKEAQRVVLVQEGRFWTAQRIVGAAVAGAGVAGVVVGAVFGLSASSKWSDAKGPAHCDPTGCDAEGVAEAHDAKTAATISTVAFVAGGVAAAGGAALFLTSAPSKPKSGVVVAPTLGGIAVGGRF
jgi:hypothetical protein